MRVLWYYAPRGNLMVTFTWNLLLDHRGRAALSGPRYKQKRRWALAPVVASACFRGLKPTSDAVRRGAEAPIFHGDPNSCLRASSKEQPDGLKLAAIKFPLGELRIVPPSARNSGGNNAEIRDRA